MTVTIVYVFPHIALPTYEPLARRFVQSYMDNPPGGHDHKIKVVIHGGIKGPFHDKLFSPLAPEFVSHNNDGRDIGAFQYAAGLFNCDLMVCLGSHVHFERPGWLDLIVRAYEGNGPALYGAYAFREPTNHIRTTNFWMPPQILQSYPHHISDSQRYMFEHGGEHSFTSHTNNMGFPCYQLTWNGVFAVQHWHHPARGDALLLDQHTDRIPWI